MKKNILFGIGLAVVLGLTSFVFMKNKSAFSTENDESKKYGDQVVMTTNLKVTTFRNGDEIPHAADAEAWERAGENKEPAWAYYDNDPSTAESCGILYNWYAVTDERGLAPEGWHVPTKDEWKQLGKYFGETYPRDLNPIKSETAWVKYENGDNSSGFNAFPCGIRGKDGAFSQFGDAAGWWSASTDGGSHRSNNSMLFTFSNVYREFNVVQNVRSGGLSVRCMKD